MDEYTHSVADDILEELADRVVELIPLLRCINAADNESWLRLHLYITERGGYTPIEASILEQLANGLQGSSAEE
jgi:hypothetical protein